MWPAIKKRFCLTLSILTVSVASFGQLKPDTLTRQLHEVFLKDSLPGLSVVLVNTKGIIYQKSFGYADIKNAVPFNSGTIQNIGSVSKTFIAVALMKAIELHYFTLETDINSILPFKVVNPNDPDGTITIRQLTNHTSGIIDNPETYPNTYLFKPGFAPYDQAAFNVLKSLGYQSKIADQPMKDFFKEYLSVNGKYYSSGNFGPGKTGSTSRYSNGASALAAYLIEIKSGLSYAEFTDRYILKPLKMTKSGWALVAKDAGNYAKPYYNLNQAFPFYSWITYPEGGLRTSALDLSKYLVEMIKGYQGKSKILDQASFKAMFTPQFSADNLPKDLSLKTRNKGIFWNLYNNGTIGHDGDDPGVSTFLFFNTKTGLGGIFICNKYLEDKQPIIDLLVKASN
jgi:CubicO group peptidase (beta-lactamase class C family)